jgi:hypothetical protein
MGVSFTLNVINRIAVFYIAIKAEDHLAQVHLNKVVKTFVASAICTGTNVDNKLCIKITSIVSDTN